MSLIPREYELAWNESVLKWVGVLRKERRWYKHTEASKQQSTMKIQKGKRVELPEEDASEIWDITFSLPNNEVVPLSTEDFPSHVSYLLA